MSLELVLFSTDHCTLCDEALDMLLSMPELAGHSVRVVDIAEDPDLLETLADHIPVLIVGNDRRDRSVRVDWPFDSGDVLGSLREME